MYEIFYVNSIKVVPQDISLLTGLALAHLIMQDGSKGTSGGLYICTDGFTPEDTKRLAGYLSSTFGLNITTPKAPGNTGSLRIYVKKSSISILQRTVVLYMHDSMLYKIGLEIKESISTSCITAK